MQKATTLLEAESHFANSTEPITCIREGVEERSCSTLAEAQDYFAD